MVLFLVKKSSKKTFTATEIAYNRGFILAYEYQWREVKPKQCITDCVCVCVWVTGLSVAKFVFYK